VHTKVTVVKIVH